MAAPSKYANEAEYQKLQQIPSPVLDAILGLYDAYRNKGMPERMAFQYVLTALAQMQYDA